MKSLLSAAFFAAMLIIPSAANAGCTLGVKDCRNGFWWVCETCGSETCMIFKGTRCLREDAPSDDITWLLDPQAPVPANMSVWRSRTAGLTLPSDGEAERAAGNFATW